MFQFFDQSAQFLIGDRLDRVALGRDPPLATTFAEERQSATCPPSLYLGSRIKPKSLKGWTFGVQRHVKPVASMLELFVTLARDGRWAPSEPPLTVGVLTPQRPVFVPADSTVSAALNGVLKNNFWAGSHVLEWSSQSKDSLLPLGGPKWLPFT